MYQGINIFGFYKNTNNRSYSSLQNDAYIASFDSTKCPPIVFICTKTANNMSFKLNDITNAATLFIENLTKVDIDDLSIFYYVGSTFAQKKDNCNAEIEITESTTGTKYYSDIFILTDDFIDKIKITASSKDITFLLSYKVPITGITFEFYLNCNNSRIFQNISEPQLNEVGVEKPNGDIPSFCTVSFDNKLEIPGNANIFKFLSLLRVLSINGNVYVTKDNETTEIYNISVSQKEDSGYQEGFIMYLSYREMNYISSRNAI